MQIIFQIAAILSVGIFVAYWRGVSLLDPLFFILFACLPAILAPPILAERRRRNPQEPELTQVRRAVLQSCAFVYLILIVSLMIVKMIPSWSTILAGFLLGAASTTVVAALTVYGLRHLSGTAVKWISRGCFLGAILLYRTMPDLVDYLIVRITIWGIVPASLTMASVAALFAALLLLPLR